MNPLFSPHSPFTNFVTAAVIIGVVAVIIASIILQFRRRRRPYTLNRSLFTPAELAFLSVLREALPEQIDFYAKVRLIDIFSVSQDAMFSGKERQQAVNRIIAKHVDFLLVRAGDGRPVLGIELDDRSHLAADRQDRDRFVNDVFDQAGLPLLRVKVQRNYSASWLRTEIDRHLTAPLAA